MLCIWIFLALKKKIYNLVLEIMDLDLSARSQYFSNQNLLKINNNFQKDQIKAWKVTYKKNIQKIKEINLMNFCKIIKVKLYNP